MISNKKVLSAFMFLVLSVSLVINVPSAHACSCVPPQQPKASMDASAAVFAGRVTEMSGEVDGRITNSGSADLIKVTFNISRVWKGVNQTVLPIFTAQSSASCGYNFEVGKEYIVYAYDTDDGRLGTGLCSRTTLLADASEDLAGLGAGDAVDESKNGAEQGGANYNFLLVPVVLLIAAAGVLGYKFASAKKAS